MIRFKPCGFNLHLRRYQKVVYRKNLQLVGVTAMLLASKYEANWAPMWAPEAGAYNRPLLSSTPSLSVRYGVCFSSVYQYRRVITCHSLVTRRLADQNGLG